jgi:hypothetical protein
MLLKLLDWLCARWLRRYEGDLPVSKAVVKPKLETMKRHLEILREIGATPEAIAIAETAIRQTVAPVQESPAFITNEQRVDTVHTPLADALSKPIVLPDVPKQTVTVQSEWQQQTGNFSVGVEADVDVGKPGGWSVGGKGLWSKATGAAATMYAQWKGKR